MTTEARMHRALTQLALTDDVIRRALDAAGLPPSRSVRLSFSSLLRVVVGQQLSTKAAATIFGRVEALMPHGVTPAALLALSDESLRTAGLSARKTEYARGLAEAIDSGSLDLATLPDLDDEAVIDALTAVRGVGRWTAQIVLMFALERPDVWPVADLGVRNAVGSLLGLKTRPSAQELEVIGERWRPYRTWVAVLAWHYLRNAPAVD